MFLDLSAPAPVLLGAINHIFQNDAYLAGLDYPLLMRALFQAGPPLPAPIEGTTLVRVADAVVLFDPERRALYRAVKIRDGVAEYFFEPVFFDAVELPDGTLIPERPTKLDFDEFVAELWCKGVRFGVDVANVKAAIASVRGERCTAARRLEPTPGQDAHVVEVSQDIHRSDAPREKSDGRLDLLSFQNRFPQIQQHMRLLRKMPSVPGEPGVELSGLPLQPGPPADLDFKRLAGAGTVIERHPDGEFLVAAQVGFLNVDTKSGQISVHDKIISRDGVSSRTTGNLALAGGFEEFGDVQELRAVDGSDITIHGNVFGNIHSSGGEIVLGANLVGGSAFNTKGNIRVKGVASGATLQTRDGDIHIAGRAESCIITGTRVFIDAASNCEIVADEVRIGLAEGCAIAARRIDIESCGPRKQSEMLMLVQVPNLGALDEELAELAGKAAALEQWAAQFRQQADQITALPQVRGYLALTAQLRKGELTLTPEQGPQLQKMAAAVAPQLKTVGELLQKVKAAESQQVLRREQAEALLQRKRAMAGQAHCKLQMVSGETLVRSMPLSADGETMYHLPAKDCKTFLRGPHVGYQTIFAGTCGALDWTYSAEQD